MKLSKFVKIPLNVALRKTEVENPLLPRVILTSKKERLLQWNLYKAGTIRSKKSVRFMEMSVL